jgi:hypothetical protein
MGFLVEISHHVGEEHVFAQASTTFHAEYNSVIMLADEKPCRIACFPGTNDDGYTLWKEKHKGQINGAFVYTQGWCYRIGATEQKLNETECSEMLVRHRAGAAPAGEDFSGNYGIVVYDPKRARLAIQPDRWAVQSIYFAVSERGVAISDRSAAVASLISASIDGYSLFSLLRGVHMPFGRSLFSGVYRVMCGCFLEVDLKNICIEVKRAASIYTPIEEMSFDDAVGRLHSTMRGIGSRLVSCSSSVFDLTGGNDTRLTAAAISAEDSHGTGKQLAWRVAGSEDSADVQIARRLANIHNWNLVRLETDFSSDATVGELQKAAIYGDGSFLVDTAYMRIQQEKRYRYADWLVGSIGGEFLRGFFWRQEMLSLGRSSRVNYTAILACRLYASRISPSSLLGARSPSVAEHDEILLEPYKRIGEIGGDTANPYKLDAMYMHKLCHSAGNMVSWLSDLVSSRLPLLSCEHTRVALSIPWKLRVNRQLMLRVIHRLDPSFTKIPNDLGKPMSPLGWVTWPLYMKTWLAEAHRRIPRLIQRYAPYWRVDQKNNVMSKSRPASWLDTVANGKHIRMIFDEDVIKDICREVSCPEHTVDKVRAFHTLLTLELLFEQLSNINQKIVFAAGQNIRS